MSERGLPMHGVSETLLEPEPDEAVRALEEALEAAGEHRGQALRRATAAHPAHLEAWARLAEHALEQGDPVAAYAFARTGYHRGLDRLRQSGWGGQGPVPWKHPPNRGFLRSVAALMAAADGIGEDHEAERCRGFLAELDPADGLGVRRG